MSKIYDVIVMGAGPAGLTAGLYAGRSRLDTLIIEKGQDGGQIAITNEIENYPGQQLEGESGPSLIARMTEQAKKFGAERVGDVIKSVDLGGDVKKLTGNKGEYLAKTVILATGAFPRPIGCKNEAKYMHFPFPIGVSTVGRVVTPGKGKEMFIANTTGTSSADRIEGMIKNAVYGIIAAKAGGVENPTVGILNVDGARQTEMALRQLQEGGYDFRFAESARADGGAVMRGNDVLQGTPDILVTDSLTGNVLIKMLSAYTTGGSFEATGYGYGPGIGKGYEKLILIISRASGAPLIANALEFAAQLVRGKVFDVAKREFDKAEKAGLNRILEARKASAKPAAAVEETVKAPPAEPVTASIPGIEVMDGGKSAPAGGGTGDSADAVFGGAPAAAEKHSHCCFAPPGGFGGKKASKAGDYPGGVSGKFPV